MRGTLSFNGKLFYIVEALRQAEIRLKPKSASGCRSKLGRGFAV